MHRKRLTMCSSNAADTTAPTTYRNSANPSLTQSTITDNKLRGAAMAYVIHV
jgi:hypothetical protein